MSQSAAATGNNVIERNSSTTRVSRIGKVFVAAIGTASVVLLAAVLFLNQGRTSIPGPEPHFKDIPVSEWIRMLGQERTLASSAIQIDPWSAIRALGTNATPYLIHELIKPDYSLNTLYYRLWHASSHLRNHLPRPEYPESIQRQRMITSMLQDSPGRDPGLINAIPTFASIALKGRPVELWNPALAILANAAKYDLRGWSAIINCLQSSEPHVRAEAAFRLSWADHTVTNAAPALREALLDSNPRVRIHAAYALYQVRREVKEPISVLMAALQETDQMLIHLSLVQLASIGPPANAAVPRLIPLTQHTNTIINGWARRALDKIKPNWYEAQKAATE